MGGDLHDGSEQRERAPPRRVQRPTAPFELCDQVLDAPAVVLQRQIPLQLLRRQARTLPLSLIDETISFYPKLIASMALYKNSRSVPQPDFDADDGPSSSSATVPDVDFD